MRVGLPLMNNLLMPLAKNVLISLGLMMRHYRCRYSKEKLQITNDYTDNLKRRNEKYHKNSQLF